MPPLMSASLPSGTDIDVSKIPNNAHPKWWKDRGLRKLAPVLAMGYCSSMNLGYDGSLIGGLFALPDFLAMLAADGPLDANRIGLVGSSLLLGMLVAYPIAPHVSDRYGRRLPIFVGCLITVGAAIMQTFTTGFKNFIGGRILMGFGVGLQTVSGTTFIAEVAHPRFRAQATSLGTTTYFVGSIIAAWFTFGTLNIKSSWSYKLPVLIQAVPCAAQITLLLIFCPESPRWLVSKGRLNEALSTLAKYHANGDESDELVLYEYNEMKTAIETEAAATAGVSYMSFFKTRGNRRRLYILVCIGFYSQWIGNGVISYYLPQILRTIGITSPSAQTGVNGGLSIWSWCGAVFGAMMSERLGRRTLWLASATGCLFAYILIIICSAVFATKGTASAGQATIAFIYVFNGFYAIGFTALGLGLYPLEILPYGLRTKGFAITGFVSLAAAFFNIYVNPLALDKIAWKYYFVFVGVLITCIANIWFVYPETSGRTLEEVQEIFDGRGAISSLIEVELEHRPEALEQDLKLHEESHQVEYAK